MSPRHQASKISQENLNLSLWFADAKHNTKEQHRKKQGVGISSSKLDCALEQAATALGKLRYRLLKNIVGIIWCKTMMALFSQSGLLNQKSLIDKVYLVAVFLIFWRCYFEYAKLDPVSSGTHCDQGLGSGTWLKTV